MAGTTPEQKQFYQEQALQLGVPAEWIADFLRRNPGDEHRILEGYAGEAGGTGAAIIAAHGGTGANVQSGPGGNLIVVGEYASPGLPAYYDMTAPSTGSPIGMGLFGGFSLTSLLVLGLMGVAAWYLLRRG
jgi:hypothetical protein